jgi:hypothetical protein
VLARLLSLLHNWADSHQARPRVVLEMWTGPRGLPLVQAAATLLMGCVL